MIRSSAWNCTQKENIPSKSGCKLIWMIIFGYQLEMGNVKISTLNPNRLQGIFIKLMHWWPMERRVSSKLFLYLTVLFSLLMINIIHFYLSLIYPNIEVLLSGI